MPGIIDQLAPTFQGARSLVLAPTTKDPARANAAFDLRLSIHPSALDARKLGLTLPLEVSIMPPTLYLFKRRYLRRLVPPIITFTPREGGNHLIRVAEVGHNGWWGAIVIPVAGDTTQEL